MQNVRKMIKSALLFAMGLWAVSCANVFFEKPVPQSGAPLRGIPADWAGLYVSEPDPAEAVTELEQIFQQCFRLERLSETQLLVSQEYRILATDLPRLRTALDEQKNEGKLMDYRVSEGMIQYTIRAENSGQPEQQYTPLVRQGDWYVLVHTVVPFRLYDLEAGLQTEYESKPTAEAVSEWLPGADTLSSKALRLVARQRQQAWYFNTQDGDGAKWSLLYVEQPSKNRLVVKISNLANADDFQRRSEYFNAITPFNKVDQNRYEIDPTDEALDRLMAEAKLFQTTYLRRIGE